LYSASFFVEGGPDELSEFEPLRSDVPSEVSWCSDALGWFQL
jgi:peptidyl-lysine (3S)-dioxygenase / protease